MSPKISWSFIWVQKRGISGDMYRKRGYVFCGRKVKETSKLSESVQSRSWICMSGTDSQSEMGYILNVENQSLCLHHIHRLRANAHQLTAVYWHARRWPLLSGGIHNAKMASCKGGQHKNRAICIWNVFACHLSVNGHISSYPSNQGVSSAKNSTSHSLMTSTPESLCNMFYPDTGRRWHLTIHQYLFIEKLTNRILNTEMQKLVTHGAISSLHYCSNPQWSLLLLVHGQVTIIFVVSVRLSVCLCRVFLSRLWSDFDQTRTHVICLDLVVSPRI